MHPRATCGSSDQAACRTAPRRLSLAQHPTVADECLVWIARNLRNARQAVLQSGRNHRQHLDGGVEAITLRNSDVSERLTAANVTTQRISPAAAPAQSRTIIGCESSRA